MIPFTYGAFLGYRCGVCGRVVQHQHVELTDFDNDPTDAKVVRYGTVILFLIISVILLFAAVYKGYLIAYP